MTTALDDRGVPLRWGFCLLLVAALHTGAAWLVLNHAAAPAVLEAAADAVMLDLPPVPAPAAPTPELAEPQPPALPTPAVPDPPTPELLPDPAVAELAPPLMPDPAPLPAPEPPVALPVPVPLPPPPVHHTQVRQPPPRPVARPAQPRPVAEAPAPAAPVPPATPVAVAPQAASNAVPTWRSELIARLQQAKRYPESARARGDRGVATVTFTLDRTGHVLSAALARSAGSEALDEEAVAMIHRAQPLPSLPPDMPGATITLTVPVTFSVR